MPTGGDGVHDVPWARDPHAFRRLRSRVLAALLRRLGKAHLELAEDALQDAFVRALETWRYGTPIDMGAWLYQVAWRKALDRLDRQRTAEQAEGRVLSELSPGTVLTAAGDDEFSDDELELLFLCAHPSLSQDVQVTLMLRTVCALSVAQIAAALLVPEATVSQRIVRAKRTLSKPGTSYEVIPSSHEARLPAVRHAIYLMFTEGYAASDGDALVRRELCREAIRLAEALATTATGSDPETFALCALLQLQASRIAAREREGIAVPLASQDRSLWDAQAITRGFRWLEQAMQGTRASRYHLQAGIASVHAAAPDVSRTDWAAIDCYYEQLRAIGDSAVLRLNHAVAISHTRGVTDALALLATLDGSTLGRSHLLFATRAQLHERAGDREQATAAAREAVALARTSPEHRLLVARLAALAPEQAGVEHPATADM